VFLSSECSSKNETEIRFKLKQKEIILKPAQNYVFDGQIYNFEQVMVQNCFSYSKKILKADKDYND
jgi:hypothetical protein